MKNKIGIIADSSAGLTIKDFDEMKNLGFCPLLITFNDVDTINDDPHHFKEKEFVERITRRKQIAKTSQTPLGQMMVVWEDMLKKYEKIIFIPLSKGLSGQYNTATMLSKEPKFKNKVSVFDSNGVSVINYVIVKKAYEMVAHGETDVNKILEVLKRISNNFSGFILPNDINYLVRGGRISKPAATLAKAIKLKPILTFDGTIDKFDTTRTWKKAVHKTLNEIEKFQKKSENKILLYVIHGAATDDAIKEVLDYAAPYNFNIKVAELPNVITAHTGVGAFAFLAFNVAQGDLPTNI